MVVLLTDREILSPGQICGQCLYASAEGEPRIQDGKVTCGCGPSKANRQESANCCPMGFRVVDMPNR